MHTFTDFRCLRSVVRIAALHVAVCALTILLPLPVNANETLAAPLTANPAVLGVDNPFVFAVFPQIGRVNQLRKVFLTRERRACTLGHVYSLDTSAMESQSLVVLRSVPDLNSLICPTIPPATIATRHEFDFAPTKTGAITIRWDLGGPDLTVQTIATAPRSKFDVNGMWFDALTDGSGIAIHHNRVTSDAAFGTWFMFNNNGDSRWYSLQFAAWQQDGGVLEGLLNRVDGACTSTIAVACPSPGRLPAPQGGGNIVESAVDRPVSSPAIARITFQSATRARAEVLSLTGAVLFTSDLTKLQF